MFSVRHTPVFLVLSLAACGSNDQASTAPLAPNTGYSRQAYAGAVVVASNAADGNALLLFPREESGALGTPVSVATGGNGSGAGLGNQGGIARSGRFILVVNAGSNDVSVFRQDGSTLTLVDRAASGGTLPVSITAFGRVVYVLNRGGSGNIAGFLLGETGRLTPLQNSIRPLSSAAADPAQIGFSPDGRHLVVTEKANNVITTYPIRDGVLAGAPQARPSAGQTPFGFAFDQGGHLLVSEAFGGGVDASALSSYRLGASGGFRVISASVGTTETAACWAAVSPDGRFVYVTNTGSASVSGYRLGPDGTVSLLNADGVTGNTGTTPIDIAFAGSTDLLYTVNSGAHTISGFHAAHDGRLESVELSATLPPGTTGLIAW